jgi:hypothetical protein
MRVLCSAEAKLHESKHVAFTDELSPPYGRIYQTCPSRDTYGSESDPHKHGMWTRRNVGMWVTNVHCHHRDRDC